ncbi:ASCH domain-containing protein [Salinibacterium sp. ZJ450]|uniref:ASCH domain-containing protein n=1 Tax=Salinibacterium sp. ZJ450 TaxID=2708338 RepID=UPI00141FB0E9|nr:ASCH domain-containing protein [Salinibacterium sp. ZJ450]
MNQDDPPRVEFAFPGPLRDRLVSAILDGSKTSTTSTAVEYRIEDDPFPQVGARQVVVDSAEKAVAVIEITDVQHFRLGLVPWEHARDEGEGHSSLSEWRAAHERYWHSNEMRSFLGNPSFTVNDDTMVVLERFRLVEVL